MISQILKLAHMSKEADKIVKGMREWESKTMNNEVSNSDLNDYDSKTMNNEVPIFTIMILMVIIMIARP